MDTSKALVFLSEDNSTPLTSSLIVAEQFGKRHHRVMRAIEDLVRGLTKNGKTQDKFFKTTYIHEQNRQSYPCYEMTRDGFTLLVMGFTGDKALQFKEAFIDAFNRMTETLIERQKPVEFQIPQTFSQALMLAARQAEQIEQQQKQIEADSKEIKLLNDSVRSMERKVSYLDEILSCKDSMPVTSIAKDYGYSAVRFNEILHTLKVQYRVGEQWVLYQKYAAENFMKSVTIDYRRSDGSRGFKVISQWTQQGRMWLYDFLKSKGIIPTKEQSLF